MKKFVLPRVGAVAAMVAALGAVGSVQAQTSTGSPLFPKAESLIAKDRLFLKASLVYSITKTKSGAPRDITGPVVTVQELRDAYDALVSQSAGAPNGALNGSHKTILFGALEDALQIDYGMAAGQESLGAPSGIRAKAGNAGTLAVSVGYYLDAKRHWAAEAILLGLPLDVTIKGAGTNDSGTAPNGLAGKDIIKTKMLPPILQFGRYFDIDGVGVRPYLGAAAMYAVFFDTRSTAAFDAYQGGKTSVSIKNAAGVGPVIGLQGDLGNGWQVGFNVGYVPFKTEATLVTRNTRIQSGDAVTNDYTDDVTGAILYGDEFAELVEPGGSGYYASPSHPQWNTNVVAAGFKLGFTSALMRQVGRTRGNADGTLGTYVRKQKTKLENTILMFSVAKTF